MSAFIQPEAVIPELQHPKVINVATRERLGELTPALAGDVFALGDPYLDAVMRDLKLRIGRVIAWNLKDP